VLTYVCRAVCGCISDSLYLCVCHTVIWGVQYGKKRVKYEICVYCTVLISPRTANVFHPLAVCREQFK